MAVILESDGVTVVEATDIFTANRQRSTEGSPR